MSQIFFNLKQVIYTATNRIEFEEVAASEGISSEIKAVFWTHRRYCGGSEYPVSVIRGFPLPNSRDVGLAMAKYTKNPCKRVFENYVSHCFVIPEALLEAVHGNLPLIAAHLVPEINFSPASGKGVDRLPEVSVSFDSSAQFRIFRFLLGELGVEEAKVFFQEYLKHWPPGGEEMPIVLREPFPVENERQVTAFQAEISPNNPPTPDLINLIRMAGLFSILPEAFVFGIPFSINEIKPSTKSNQSQHLTVILNPEHIQPYPSEKRPWEWFDHCVSLANELSFEDGATNRLLNFKIWLSQVYPRTIVPCSENLDSCTRLYRDLIDPDPGPPTPCVDRIILSLQGVAGLNLEISPLLNNLRAYLNTQDVSRRKSFEAYQALAMVAAGAVTDVIESLVPQLLEYFDWSIDPDGAVQRKALETLPDTITAAIWKKAFTQNSFPAKIDVDDPTHKDVQYLASVFDTIPAHEVELLKQARDQILQTVVGATIFCPASDRSPTDVLMAVLGCPWLERWPAGLKESFLDDLLRQLAPKFGGPSNFQQLQTLMSNQRHRLPVESGALRAAGDFLSILILRLLGQTHRVYLLLPDLIPNGPSDLDQILVLLNAMEHNCRDHIAGQNIAAHRELVSLAFGIDFPAANSVQRQRLPYYSRCLQTWRGQQHLSKSFNNGIQGETQVFRNSMDMVLFQLKNSPQRILGIVSAYYCVDRKADKVFSNYMNHLPRLGSGLASAYMNPQPAKPNESAMLPGCFADLLRATSSSKNLSRQVVAGLMAVFDHLPDLMSRTRFVTELESHLGRVHINNWSKLRRELLAPRPGRG